MRGLPCLDVGECRGGHETHTHTHTPIHTHTLTHTHPSTHTHTHTHTLTYKRRTEEFFCATRNKNERLCFECVCEGEKERWTSERTKFSFLFITCCFFALLLNYTKMHRAHTRMPAKKKKNLMQIVRGLGICLWYF